MTYLLLALLVAGPLDEGDAGGPPRLANHLPFASLFLSTPPLDARIPSRRRFEVRFGATSTFAWPDHVAAGATGQAHLPGTPLDLAALAAEAAADPAATLYFADAETARLDLLFTQPLGRRALLEVEVPLLTHSGGWMDGIIESWHRAFGMADLGRPDFPAGSGQLAYFHGGDAFAAAGQLGPALGDVTVRGLGQFRRGGATAWALSGAVKLPVGAPSKLAGSGTWDAGLGLHLTRAWSRGLLHATVGANVHGGWRGMPSVDVRPSADLHLGYEYRVDGHWSWLAQVSLYGSPLRLRESDSLDNPASLYALAARFRDGDRWELEWGFVENIANHANTHDFGLYSRVRFWP